ncbi:MAG: hypothetical protein MnENMB40S_00590 [Rhizobiaceae bacterium MnEN-MB40S]|nr:MAG: hypothetical protein MnENMB40S_00590 [Rhizobiaceae bacterium MnEN-MB40S]
MTTRRTFLKLVGGGVILAAAGATWVATRTPATARDPWLEAAEPPTGERASDVRRFALSYAILAPNPHNMQPWIADLSEPDAVRLYCDPARKLPETDPYDRQTVIGLGCFSELLAMAANAAGYSVDVIPFPEGEPQPRLDERPVARFVFRKDEDAAVDPLFRHVTDRRTNREAFDTARPVANESLERMLQSVRSSDAGFTNDEKRVADLREFSWSAMEVELYTPRVYQESVDVMRVGSREMDRNPDGIAVDGPMIELLAAAGLISHKDLADVSSITFEQGLPLIRVSFETAMAFAWMSTAGNTRRDQLAAGRDYIRLHLAATGEGLALQPFSQALQEYPEMAGHYAAIRKKLAIDDGATLQMFVRLGYGSSIEPSPRWPYDSRIEHA